MELLVVPLLLYIHEGKARPGSLVYLLLLYGKRNLLIELINLRGSDNRHVSEDII